MRQQRQAGQQQLKTQQALVQQQQQRLQSLRHGHRAQAVGVVQGALRRPRSEGGTLHAL
jgi:hypothetical protein